MITAAMVKELRERSGAGMIDCKNALTEASGDVERAVELLREKGLSAIAKKAGRVASEGISYATVEGDLGIIVEVNSETDFVAKNSDFTSFVADVAKQIARSSTTDVEDLLKEKWINDSTITVEDALSQKISVIGEKLSIRRFQKYVAQGTIVTYIHSGGKVAVILELTGSESPQLTECGKNVAMQIAAMNPQFIDRSQVPGDYISKEKEILTKQALEEGKPANIVEKMVEGRINKNLQAICLVDQEYVKDGDLTIQKYLEQVSKEVGHDVKIAKFTRYETGEGIEKKEENFAEEVRKSMG